MKRVVVFILAFLYLGITSGLAVNIHYCMGKIDTIKINSSTNDGCAKSGKKSSMPCCGSESKLIKVSDEHQVVDNTVSFHSPVILLPLLNIYILAFAQQNIGSINSSANAPPLSPPDICIKNCIFRI